MDGERSNSDVMTLTQAGSRKRAKLPWTTGLLEEPPTEGPKYRIEGAGDAGAYLYHRIYNDGAEIVWLERPNKFMVPLNDEARAAVRRYQLENKIRDLRRQESEEIARSHDSKSPMAVKLHEEVGKLEAELCAMPERAPKKKPVAKPRNNEV